MSDIVLETHDGVLELRLARPAKKNALTLAMYRALNAGLDQAAADESIRAVLFTADGETFCAGNDLRDFMNGLGEDIPVFRFIEKLVTFEKPLVAAVHGAAIGLGMTMLLHCDLVYATPEARLVTPFVSLGLVPEAGSSLLLPRRIGYAASAELLLLDKPMEGERARELGLVNELVSKEALRGHALERAQTLAKKPPQALALSRKMLRGDTGEVLARVREEAEIFAQRLVSPEALAAFAAFAERRAKV